MKRNCIQKRMVSVVLVLVILASMCPVSMAVTAPVVSPEAMYLNQHGILLGSGGDLRLEDDFTVEELLTILARLAGKEAEAEAYPVTDNFRDVPATSWSAPYTAWAKATGVSTGKPDGTIGYAEKVTAQRLAAFLLRTMGYADVPYANVIERAASLGFMKASQAAGTPLLRGAVAEIVHDAMQANTQTGSTLAVDLGFDVPQQMVSFTGTYVSDSDYRIDLDVSKLPADMPKDVKLRYGGISASFLSTHTTAAQIDTAIYNMNSQNRHAMESMNGGIGGVYPLSLVILYSPSADKAWYHLFTQKMAAGTVFCSMRMIDFAARDEADVTAVASYNTLRDDGHAAYIDANGILQFDATKWKETPVRFCVIPSGSIGETPNYQDVMLWMPEYLKTAIAAGEPYKNLGGPKPAGISARDWIFYLSATDEIVGYTNVTAQDIANYYGSFSSAMPFGIVQEQGIVYGYLTDGTQPGMQSRNAYALYVVPGKAAKYAYVAAGDYDELQSVAFIATMEQNQAMPSGAQPLTDAVPYCVFRGSLSEERGVAARFFDADKKLVAIETLTKQQMDEMSVDIVTARLPAPGGLFCGLDQTGISREYLANNIMVRISLDGTDVATVPINKVSWVGIGLHGGTNDLVSGRIIEHPYVTVSGLYGYGGRLKYTLVMPSGEEFSLN